VMLVSIFTHHWIKAPGTAIQLDLFPFSTPATAGNAQWTVETLWDPQHPQSLDELRRATASEPVDH